MNYQIVHNKDACSWGGHMHCWSVNYQNCVNWDRPWEYLEKWQKFEDIYIFLINGSMRFYVATHLMYFREI